jgi:MTH538 TIR-like domain (DUF1863)
MADEIRNVFISHIHEDDEGLAKLKELLAKSDFYIRDASISSETPNAASNPDYIKQEVLAPGIRWASTLLVYITPETRNSEWVNWEIEYAEKIGKRIVGIWAHGASESNLPTALDTYADAVVGWNSDRIIDAISGQTKEWTTSDGGLRAPRPIARYSCR